MRSKMEAAATPCRPATILFFGLGAVVVGRQLARKSPLRSGTDVPLLRGGYGRARRPNHLLYCSVSLFSILAGGGGGTQQGVVAPPPPPGRHGRQGGGWCGTGGTGGVAVVVAQPFRRPAAPTGSSFFAPLTLPPIDLLRMEEEEEEEVGVEETRGSREVHRQVLAYFKRTKKTTSRVVRAT